MSAHLVGGFVSPTAILHHAFVGYNVTVMVY